MTAGCLLEAAPALRPDVVVLDVHMQSLNGLSVGEKLIHSLTKVKLVYLTMSHEVESAAEAFRLGGSAYVLQKSTTTELVTAIRL